MAQLNEVRLIGRLTRDPVLKSTTTGQNVAEFGLATSRKYKGSDQIQKEETTFVDINCWGGLADVVCRNLGRGRLVYVGGRLKFDSWEDKTTGQKRSKLRVVADNVQFLDWPSDGQPSNQGNNNYSPVQNQEHGWSPPGGGMSPSSPASPPSGPGNEWDQPDMDEPPF